MGERSSRTATDTDGLLLGDFAPGSWIGDYRVEFRLPSRGNGILYAASHAVLPRRVMIKVMPSSHAWSRALAMQLLREALIVEALDHPGVPRVHECGTLNDRRPWVATELVDGTTLANVIAERQLGPAEALVMIRDAAEVLAYAHARGLIQNNVRPSTIRLADPARQTPLVLTDWSQARAHDSNAPLPMLVLAMERAYLAPEQLRGASVTAASDIYALGVILHEALLGELPVSTHAFAPDRLPTMVMALIENMLATDPYARPTSAKLVDIASWMLQYLDDDETSDETDDDVGSPSELDAGAVGAQPLDLVRSELTGLVGRADTETDLAAPCAITSEHSQQVSGEISIKFEDTDEHDRAPSLVSEAPSPARTISSEQSAHVSGEITVARTSTIGRIALARLPTPRP